MLTAKEIPIRERKSFGQTRPFQRSHDLHIQVKCVVYCEMRNIKQFNACSQTSDRHLALTRKRKQACESRGPVRGARGRPRRRGGSVESKCIQMALQVLVSHCARQGPCSRGRDPAWRVRGNRRVRIRHRWSIRRDSGEVLWAQLQVRLRPHSLMKLTLDRIDNGARNKYF